MIVVLAPMRVRTSPLLHRISHAYLVQPAPGQDDAPAPRLREPVLVMLRGAPALMVGLGGGGSESCDRGGGMGQADERWWTLALQPARCMLAGRPHLSAGQHTMTQPQERSTRCVCHAHDVWLTRSVVFMTPVSPKSPVTRTDTPHVVLGGAPRMSSVAATLGPVLTLARAPLRVTGALPGQDTVHE